MLLTLTPLPPPARSPAAPLSCDLPRRAQVQWPQLMRFRKSNMGGDFPGDLYSGSPRAKHGMMGWVLQDNDVEGKVAKHTKDLASAAADGGVDDADL